MKTLVLGLGNPILGDDGVGVRVAEAVQTELPPGAPVEVAEACTGGLSLMERMVGFDRVVLVDALCGSENPPGRLAKLSLDDLATLSPTQHSASAHDTSLVTALAAGRRMGLALPEQITVLAVTVDADQIEEFRDTLTPAVARVVPLVVRAVLAELGATGAQQTKGPAVTSNRRPRNRRRSDR